MSMYRPYELVVYGSREAMQRYDKLRHGADVEGYDLPQLPMPTDGEEWDGREWGCRTGSRTLHREWLTVLGCNGRSTYVFSTESACPEQLFDRLAALFPELTFGLSEVIDDQVRPALVWKNGRRIPDEEREPTEGIDRFWWGLCGKGRPPDARPSELTALCAPAQRLEPEP